MLATTPSRVLVTSKISGPVSLWPGSWPCCTSLCFEGGASKADLLNPSLGHEHYEPSTLRMQRGYMLAKNNLLVRRCPAVSL